MDEQLMENIQMNSSSENKQPVLETEPSVLEKRVKLLTISFIVTSIIIIATLVTSLYYSSKNYKTAESKINQLNKEISTQKDTIKWLKELSIFNYIQHEIENGDVTDDLVVEKITFYDSDKPSILIDVSTQPSMLLKYKGKGKFDLPDRELKGMLKEIITKVEETYKPYATEYSELLLDFKDYEIDLTIQNYELGKYSNGVVKLKGEY